MLITDSFNDNLFPSVFKYIKLGFITPRFSFSSSTEMTLIRNNTEQYYHFPSCILVQLSLAWIIISI